VYKSKNQREHDKTFALIQPAGGVGFTEYCAGT